MNSEKSENHLLPFIILFILLISVLAILQTNELYSQAHNNPDLTIKVLEDGEVCDEDKCKCGQLIIENGCKCLIPTSKKEHGGIGVDCPSPTVNPLTWILGIVSITLILLGAYFYYKRDSTT